MKNKYKIFKIATVLVCTLTILIGLFFFLSQVFSKANTNKVLLYTSFDNLNSKKEVDLVLFFPGFTIGSPGLLANFDFGGLGLNPYLENNYRENIIFASIDTNPVANWGSPDAVKSVLSNIKKLLEIYSIKRIYIIGGSMGSALALNISSLAPNEIKEKIAGVIAYLPITDYNYTLENCKNPPVKEAIYNHFTNNNELLVKSSPITYVESLPEKTKIILISTIEDQTVPSNQVDVYFNKAKELGKNIFLYKTPGDHNTGYIQNAFKPLVQELLR